LDKQSGILKEILKTDVVFPVELVRSILTLSYDSSENAVKSNLYSMIPNVTFDYYSIEANNFSLNGFKSLFVDDIITSMNRNAPAKGKFETGFLKLNNKNLVSPANLEDNDDLSNLVGIWMTNVPAVGHDGKAKLNPYIWAACVRFIL